MERSGAKETRREIGIARQTPPTVRSESGRLGPPNRLVYSRSRSRPVRPVSGDGARTCPRPSVLRFAAVTGWASRSSRGRKTGLPEPVAAAMAEPGDPAPRSPAADLVEYLNGGKFGTVLADPPWRFANRTGKVAPEHRRLSRYGTLTVEEIAALPVARLHAGPRPLLSLGSERAPAAWPARARIVGVRVQEQPDLAQDTQGRRLGRARGRVLFPQRDRDGAVRHPREERAHAPSRAPPGQPDRQPEARAFPQAGRAIRADRELQLGAVSRTVRARGSATTGRCGAIRPRRATSRTGRPTATTRRRPRLEPGRPRRSGLRRPDGEPCAGRSSGRLPGSAGRAVPHPVGRQDRGFRTDTGRGRRGRFDAKAAPRPCGPGLDQEEHRHQEDGRRDRTGRDFPRDRPCAANRQRRHRPGDRVEQQGPVLRPRSRELPEAPQRGARSASARS